MVVVAVQCDLEITLQNRADAWVLLAMSDWSQSVHYIIKGVTYE